MTKLNMSAEGRVVVRRLDKQRNEIERLEFVNDFLQVGLDHLTDYCMTWPDGVTYGDAFCNRFNYLFLGTGTTEPTPQDTGLENRSGTLVGKPHTRVGSGPHSFTRNAGVDTVNKVYWTEAVLTFQYGEGESEGVWTELGLATDLSYTNPLTHALFRDENGAAISLTILSDEYLEVTYTVRFYSGVSDPEPDSVTINGTPYGFKLHPIKGGVNSGWLSDGTSSSYSSAFEDTGLWAFYFPFNTLQTSTGIDLGGPVYQINGETYGAPSNGSYDAPSKTITHTFVFGPTSGNVTLDGFLCCSRHDGYSDGAKRKALYAIVFDAPFVKKADYQVTFTITATIAWSGKQLTGVQMTSATATTLDFSWDAFPGATEYELVLRKAGTIVNTQTVTAPTITASFTGLSASTAYDLDIRAITSNLDGSRSIHSGSTTA